MDELKCDDSHYQGKGFKFTSAFDKGFSIPIRCAIYPHGPVVGTTFTIKGKTTENFESFSVNLTLSRAEHLDNCEVHYNPRLRAWRWPRRVVHRVNKQWGPSERQDSVFTKDFSFELIMEVTPSGYSVNTLCISNFSVNLASSRDEDLAASEVHYNPRHYTWPWTPRVVVLNHRMNKQWGTSERQDSVFTKDFTFELVMEVTPCGYSFRVSGGKPSFYKRTRRDCNRDNEKYLVIKGDVYIYSIQIEDLQISDGKKHTPGRQPSSTVNETVAGRKTNGNRPEDSNDTSRVQNPKIIYGLSRIVVVDQ